MPSLKIVNISEVKTYLQKGDIPADDPFINQIIPTVSDFINRIAGPVASTSYTDKFDGGVENIVLPYTPIISIESITPDGGTVVDSDLYDYDPESGLVFLKSGALWTSGRRYYEIEWTAGYASIPRELKLATLMLIAKYAETKDPNILSERIGDWQKSEDPDMRHLFLILEPFMDVAI